MTKQDYINQRTQNMVDFQLGWEMYISVLKGNPPIPQHLFNQLFPMYIEVIRGDMTGYFRYYDQKFGVNQLTKKDGSVIYC
jgi:hypothetical protein